MVKCEPVTSSVAKYSSPMYFLTNLWLAHVIWKWQNNIYTYTFVWCFIALLDWKVVWLASSLSLLSDSEWIEPDTLWLGPGLVQVVSHSRNKTTRRAEGSLGPHWNLLANKTKWSNLLLRFLSEPGSDSEIVSEEERHSEEWFLKIWKWFHCVL